MNIRLAENKDIPEVINLLQQVLEIHASIRPDIFISGTTKYTSAELEDIFKDETRRTYVAVADEGKVLGYAFCMIKEPIQSNSVVPFRSLYVDDICVDESARGQHVGQALFEHVKNEAKKMGCYCIDLNVWEGNDSAQTFYKNLGLKTRKTNMEYIL